MNCPDDIQYEDDFLIDVSVFWDQIAIVMFILQLCCAIGGVFIVFCSTKRELRPNFVTAIWALIIVTLLFLIIEAIALQYSLKAQSEEQAEKLGRVSKIIEALA